MSVKIRGTDIAFSTITNDHLVGGVFPSVYIPADNVIGGGTGGTALTATYASDLAHTWSTGSPIETLLNANLNWLGGRQILVNGTLRVTFGPVAAGWDHQIEFSAGVYYDGIELSQIKYTSLYTDATALATDAIILSVPITAFVPLSISGMGHPLAVIGIMQNSKRVGFGTNYPGLSVDTFVNILEIS